MLMALKTLFKRLPLPWRKPSPEQFATRPSQALRQLNRRYQRQKRLWVYSFLYSVALMVIYCIFAILLPCLWEYVIPIAWIVLAGIVISILQVRRSNDVIHTLREAHSIQYQIEKAEAEKAEKEAEEGKAADGTPTEPRPASNGSQRPPDIDET